MSTKDAEDAEDPKPKLVAARNDNSSLFTLAALRKVEASTQKEPKRDDSGLIDLGALATLEQGAAPAPAASTPESSAGLFGLPFGSIPASLTAPRVETMATAAAPPSPRRTGLFLGGGAILAVGAAVAAFVALKGPPEVPAVPSAAVVAVVAPPPPPPPAAEEPKVAARIPGAPIEKEAAPAAPSASAPPKLWGTLHTAAPKVTAADVAPPPPPPPKPTGPVCDLTCQMQKAVSGKH